MRVKVDQDLPKAIVRSNVSWESTARTRSMRLSRLLRLAGFASAAPEPSDISHAHRNRLLRHQAPGCPLQERIGRGVRTTKTTRARTSFMPLFGALAWDTQDSAEVSAEEKVSLAGVQRRVEGGQSAAGAVHRVRRGQLSDRLRATVVALPARNQ